MKMAKSGKITLISCIIDQIYPSLTRTVQLEIRALNLNACKVISVILIFSGLNSKTARHNFAGIEIQAEMSKSNLHLLKLLDKGNR